jgi:hypothetical protein
MILGRNDIGKLRLRTKLTEAKSVFETSPYPSQQEIAKRHLAVLQEEYKALTGEYAEEFLIKEEEFVNGTNTEEFNRLVSKLVDHELEELESEEEEGISKESCQKIKDYLVQNKLYVASEKKEGVVKPTNE